MRITIAGEDYKTLSRCLLGLHSYFFTLHCCFPQEQEERILCMMLVLRTLCDKIFAFQPSQESVSHTLKATLRKYFAHKNEAQIPSMEQAGWLTRICANSRLVQDFVEKGSVNDLSAYVGQALHKGALEKLRADIPQKGIPLQRATAADLAAGRVLLSAKELAGYWKQAANRSDVSARQFKNAVICGKYLALLEDNALLLALCDSSLYTALDVTGKRSSMELITAAFPLMNESQKKQIEQLANGIMADYRDEILALRHQSHVDQFGLMDLFRFGSNAQIKQGLLAFGKALVHDKGVCFYIDYDLSSVAWSELEGFSEAIDDLVSLLHRDFLQQQDRADYDVWGNDTFRIIWLLSIIWFRKLFHEFKSATI